MTQQVGPVPHKADNHAGSSKPFSATGPRCADIHDGPASPSERQLEAEYTTATSPTRLQLLFVSTCGRSPYMHG